MFARGENDVTKFSPKKQKTPKNGSETAVSVGNFHFFAAEKLTLGYNQGRAIHNTQYKYNTIHYVLIHNTRSASRAIHVLLSPPSPPPPGAKSLVTGEAGTLPGTEHGGASRGHGGAAA